MGEKFSELQTVWRWTQSDANPSLPKFPLTGKNTGNFAASSALECSLPRKNSGVSGFQAEIVTGNEQGNNRRGNREGMPRNRSVGLLLLTEVTPSGRKRIKSLKMSYFEE